MTTRFEISQISKYFKKLEMPLMFQSFEGSIFAQSNEHKISKG
jgi:hypothetical protein